MPKQVKSAPTKDSILCLDNVSLNHFRYNKTSQRTIDDYPKRF